MKNILVTTTAMAISLSSFAGAQPTSDASAALGETWDQETVSAFFTEGDSLTPRSDSEIQSNWTELSEDEQAKVQADCASLDTQMRNDGASGAMDDDGPATSVPAADTDAADAIESDLAPDAEGDSEGSDASTTGDTDRATTADGGPLGSDRIGAAAGAAAQISEEAGEAAPSIGAAVDSGQAVSGAGPEETPDLPQGGETAVTLDVALGDFQHVCAVIGEADEM